MRSHLHLGALLVLAVLFLPAAASARQHLYVGDQFSGVTAYPIKDDGLLDKPSSFLEVRQGIDGMSLGPDGDIYVITAVRHRGTIEVFPPDANGAVAPLRSLYLDLIAYSVAVSPDGYLFVGGNEAYIEVFRAAAHGHPKPLRIINIRPEFRGFPFGLGFDAAGELFVAQINNVLVYSDPAHRTRLVRHFCAPDWDFAFDENSVYISEGREGTAVDEYPLDVSGCPVNPMVRFSPLGYRSGGTTGVAVWRQRLYSLNWLRHPSIVVFATTEGTQSPLQVVPIRGVANPIWMAIGR